MTAIETSRRITVEVNGTSYEREVEARRLLIHLIRDDLDLTGSHIGCDTGNCGACSVLVDGVLVKSCLMLAVQADGCRVQTVEGLAPDGELTPLQQAFHEHHALQCGYCTPGMLIAATALLAKNPRPSDEEIRKGLQGNICRCTGYWNIIKAVKAASGQEVGGMSETIVAPERDGGRGAGRAAELGRPERPAQGGPPARPGAGRLRRRHQAPQHGLRAYVRSPYAHAVIKSVDVSAALAVPGRLRDAHRRRGGDADRSVLPALDGARERDQGLRARRRPRPLRRRSGRDRRRRDARARTRRRRAGRGRLRAAAGDHRRTARPRRGRARHPPRRRLEPRLGGHLRVGELGRRGRRGRPDRQDLRAPLRPLQLDPARMRRRARRVQPRHRAVDALHEQPVPGLRRDHDGAGDPHRASTSCASSPRTSAAGSATRSPRTRSSSRCACSRGS